VRTETQTKPEKENEMNKQEVTELVKDALTAIEVGEPIDIADCTVIFKNEDGTWSVCDNGEEVICRTENDVIDIACENLVSA
jgi:hypothetical protein